MPGSDLARDESIRPGSTPEILAKLKPSFRPDGTIIAGNASPLNDGASAVLLGSRAGGGGDREPARGPDRRSGQSRRGPAGFRLRTGGGGEPRAARGRHQLVRRGRGRAQRGVRRPVAGLPGRLEGDPEIVNTRGGAIAIGHPLGASGTRILGTLTGVLRERRERWGVAAICIGVGQGLAVVVENTAGG